MLHTRLLLRPVVVVAALDLNLNLTTQQRRTETTNSSLISNNKISKIYRTKPKKTTNQKKNKNVFAVFSFSLCRIRFEPLALRWYHSQYSSSLHTQVSVSRVYSFPRVAAAATASSYYYYLLLVVEFNGYRNRNGNTSSNPYSASIRQMEAVAFAQEFICVEHNAT